MVAESLVHTSGLCLIKDTFENNSTALFQHYIQSWASSQQPYIIVFALMTPPSRITSWLKEAKKAVIVDGLTNSAGWDQESSPSIATTPGLSVLPCVDTLSLHHLQTLFSQALDRMKSPAPHQVSVVFDSLSVLLVEHSAGRVRQFIQSLYDQCEAKRSRVVGFLHADTMSSQEMAQLEYGAQTVVQVEKPMAMLEEVPGSRRSDGPSAFLRQESTLQSQRLLVIRHDRPSGRVAWATEGYGVESDGSVVSMKVPKKMPVTVDSEASGSTLDPTANLTFNLKLTEQEQSAKDKLVLPYMHHLHDSAADPAQSGSTIIYYDSDDDFDEEDPDDDLDI